MFYSMIAVLAVSAILWAMFPGEGTIQRRTDDIEAVAVSLAEDVDYPVYVPRDLGEGWIVTLATITEIGGQPTWRVGVQTPSGDYIALSQTAEATQQWRDAVLRQTGPLSEQTIDSPAGEITWEVHVGGGGTGLAQLPEALDEPGVIVFTQSAPDDIFDFVAHLDIASPVVTDEV